MPNLDSQHHVVKTSSQWNERAVEFWVVPRGCLCVELTPRGKTKIKVGEGNKYFSQLPYVCGDVDPSNYYTKEEINNILNNFNRMAIMSTNEYDSKNDLPMTGNKLGDVRFVKSASPSIKIDPDIYLWNGTRWIYVGSEFPDIDLSKYLKKEEFHELFDPVKLQVDEMYPMRHTHTNKDVLDQTTAPYTIPEKEKLAGLHNYDDTEIRELIHETGHTHPNKALLDMITPTSLWSAADREKFDSLHNYDDTAVVVRIETLESKAHTHDNKNILDQITAPFTTQDKTKLDSLHNDVAFVGTDGMYPGVEGNVPAPKVTDVGKFLSSDGTWKAAGFDIDFVGATRTEDGEHGLVPAPLAGEQSYYLRGDGTWAKVKSGDKYRAGDGIYILAGEAISDTYPFKIYSRSAYLTQYIIYGTDAGVGEWDAGQNKFVINLSITADGETPIVQQILLDNKLYAGDYIDFERQIIVTSKQDMKDYVTLYKHPSYGTSGTYQWRDGSIGGNYYYNPGVTNNIAVTPGDRYWIKAFPDEYIYADNSYHCIFNANDQVTRYFAAKGAGPMIIEIQPGETYARFVGKPSWNMVQPGFLYKLEQSQESTVLPRISLFPGKINTVNVTNTNKPSQIYVKAYSDEPEDPDDPTSFFTGIIYNEGVLDVTQEDPNALNELTVHFRDDSKVLTLPEAEPMTGATTSTDGTGGTVPAPLMGQEEMFLRGDGTWANVPGSGEAEQYGAGAGINIIKGEASGDKFPINIASNDNYLEEYIIYGTEAGVGDYDSTTHKYVIPVVVTAKDEDPIRSYIYLDDPLGQGEYVIYSDQKAVKYRENVLLSAGYESGQFLADGHRYTGDVDQYMQPIAFVTHKITMVYGDRYTLSGLTFDKHESSTKNFQHWHSFNDLSVVEITPYSASPISVPQPCGPVNRDDIEITVLGYEDNLYKARFYHHFGTAKNVPTTLAQITIYAGKINTLDVETTNKPDQIYVRAHVNTDPDAPPIPETWIIENTGIIDVEQDETDRNKLTFKYKDTDKVITIPGGGGSSYTPGNGIDITNDEISAKLGDGLSFDNNDAITVDEMTGASASADGASGTVPAPSAGDETKFLRGDGTWQTVSGGTQYQAGQGIEIEPVPELIDQHFNYTDYINTVQGVEHGSIVKNNNDSFTITSTADDAYTYPYNPGYGALYTMAVEPNTKYRLTMDLSDWTVDSYVNVFKNRTTAYYWRADMPGDPYLEFTTESNTTEIAFRFGVTYGGHTQTFSNIKLYQVSESTTTDSISAKLGSGLQFDANNAIEVQPATTTTLGGVKVGAGLSMNANDELGVTSPYVTSVANQGAVPGVITVAKSDGTSSDVDVLENLRLILNCNYDSTVTRSQLGEPVNAPQSGRTIGSPIMGDLTIIEVNE